MTFVLVISVIWLLMLSHRVPNIFKSRETIMKELEDKLAELRRKSGDKFKALFMISVLIAFFINIGYYTAVTMYLNDNKIISIAAAYFISWAIFDTCKILKTLDGLIYVPKSFLVRLFNLLASYAFTIYVIYLVIKG
jgi:hypothetical protein